MTLNGGTTYPLGLGWHLAPPVVPTAAPAAECIPAAECPGFDPNSPGR